ncbi:hypothetical protein HA402_003934 [Bradysia odoriphaga]|nr:hypothetical protein HA402_003934 [Bradysia odoriphaga]
MFRYPKRLSELSPISLTDEDEEDTGSKKSPVKLQPKRLDELYSESSVFDELYEDEDPAQSNESSGFDEKDIDSERDRKSSTPFGKENDLNSANRNGASASGTCKRNGQQLSHERNLSKPSESTATMCSMAKNHFDPKSAKNATDPLKPRSLLFSPIELLKATQKNAQNMPQHPIDDFFATPSIKPPLTTGRIIFSSSQNKQRQPRKLTPDYQKTLFTTPQPVTNSHISTSDYGTDSFNSLRNPSFLNVLSPIDEEKISIDDFNSLSANDSGTALENKVIEINGKEFILKKKIGSGGSCLVYSSKCKLNGADRALKVVNLRTDPANVESYLNETKCLEKLQGNANVIKLFEYLHRPDKYSLFLVMELGETDLNKVLKSYESDIPLVTIISYWHQMLTAVKCIHDNHVIHSDLKPANFLIVNGRLKLIDFGIASSMSLDATSINKFQQTGTLNYISPEALIDTSTGSTPQKLMGQEGGMSQKRNRYKISRKSDIWSLGCIFYLTVYRRTPFSHIKQFYAKFAAITSPDTVIDYPSLPVYYPPMLSEMIQKCLQFNPKNRSSAAELLNYPMNMIDPSIS